MARDGVPDSTSISLLSVRRWSRTKAVTQNRFRVIVKDSVLIGVSLLLDAVRREFPDIVEVRRCRGEWLMAIGTGPKIEARLTGSPLFPPMHIAEPPCVDGVPLPFGRPGKTIEFIAGALVSAGADLAVGPVRRLFLNSIANLVLNRLLASPDVSEAVPEPAWQGHGYFPFPGLRCGPTADDVSRFCNLTVPKDHVVFAWCEGLVRHTPDSMMMPQWEELWSPGQTAPPGAVPLHPWNRMRSATVRDLIDGGWLRLTSHRLTVQPLASQRTCRIEHGGFDVKLALDARLTGERRLLYRFNTTNAPAVSAVVTRALHELSAQLNFQSDVASFSHPVAQISPFLSCIVRAPPPVVDDEALHPAIELWTGRCRAAAIFALTDRNTAEDLMASYALALLAGPVLAWSGRGLGFEPHIQNVSVRVRGTTPSGITLRDLDATIIDQTRLPPEYLCGIGGLDAGTWDAMPIPNLGRNRLAHALGIGHLAMVANLLHRQFGARYGQLHDAIQDAWSMVEAIAPASEQSFVRDVRAAASHTKRSLSMVVAGDTMMRFS